MHVKMKCWSFTVQSIWIKKPASLLHISSTALHRLNLFASRSFLPSFQSPPTPMSALQKSKSKSRPFPKLLCTQTSHSSSLSFLFPHNFVSVCSLFFLTCFCLLVLTNVFFFFPDLFQPNTHFPFRLLFLTFWQPPLF